MNNSESITQSLEGVKVKNIKSSKIKTIRIIPSNKNLSDLIKAGNFDIENEISINSYEMTKHLHTIVNE